MILRSLLNIATPQSLKIFKFILVSTQKYEKKSAIDTLSFYFCNSKVIDEFQFRVGFLLKSEKNTP